MNESEMKGRVAQAANVAALHPADHEWDVFAQLRSVKELQTKAGKPFLVLELGDLSGTIEGKVWSNSAEAMAAAKAAAPGSTLKLRGRVDEYQGKGQFVVDRLRVVGAGEQPEGYDPDQLVDPALAAVEDLCCRTLVFDIETVPAHDRRELPTAIAAAAWSCVLKMLHEAQRTSAPSSTSVSISTAVWMVMCSEPVMRAPLSGWLAANSSRMAMRPGISVSAMLSSLRPQSASEMSATT